jgi:serine/threonine-protein kinase
MATELTAAPTLRDVAARDPLDADRMLPVVAALADALDAAGDAGLVHRDLRAGTVLLASGDLPLLVDLGFADPVREGGEAAPEEIAGEPATFRSNVYSLAAIFAATVADPELPPEAERVLATAMASAPGDRHPSCRAFADELTRAFARAGAPAGHQVPAPVPVRTPVPPTTPVPAPAPVPVAAPLARARVAEPVRRRSIGQRARAVRPPRFALPRRRGRLPSIPRATAIVAAAAVVAAIVGFGVGRIGGDGGADHVVGATPASAQARQLTGVVATLNRVRVRQRGRLAGTRAPKTRAEAAAAIATAYRVAAESLSGTSAARALSRRLSRAADAYGDLATAALRAKPAALKAASRSVAAAERRVDRQLRLTAS